MDLKALEAYLKAALITAGYDNIITQKRRTNIPGEQDLDDTHFDKSIDPPRLSFIVLNAQMTGSRAAACGQVFEDGIMTIDVYLGVNDEFNSEQVFLDRVNGINQVLQTMWTYGGLVEMSGSTTISPISTIDIFNHTAFTVQLSRSFEGHRVVEYV